MPFRYRNIYKRISLAAVIAGLILFFSLVCEAQKTTEWGAHLGIPFGHERLHEGLKYKPWQLLLYHKLADLKPRKPGRFIMALEPQLVWVHFSPKAKKEWEAGANLVFEYRWPLGSQAMVYAAIGSGPPFISVHTTQQARGFIFSDNFTAGFSHRIGKGNTWLDLKCRFRHISNAGLKEPNLGIDSWFAIAGLRWSWER